MYIYRDKRYLHLIWIVCNKKSTHNFILSRPGSLNKNILKCQYEGWVVAAIFRLHVHCIFISLDEELCMKILETIHSLNLRYLGFLTYNYFMAKNNRIWHSKANLMGNLLTICWPFSRLNTFYISGPYLPLSSKDTCVKKTNNIYSVKCLLKLVIPWKIISL